MEPGSTDSASAVGVIDLAMIYRATVSQPTYNKERQSVMVIAVTKREDTPEPEGSVGSRPGTIWGSLNFCEGRRNFLTKGVVWKVSRPVSSVSLVQRVEVALDVSERQVRVE